MIRNFPKKLIEKYQFWTTLFLLTFFDNFNFLNISCSSKKKILILYLSFGNSTTDNTINEQTDAKIHKNDKDGGRSKYLRGTIAKEYLFLLIFYVGKQCIAMGRGGRACATSAPPVLPAMNRCKNI